MWEGISFFVMSLFTEKLIFYNFIPKLEKEQTDIPYPLEPLKQMMDFYDLD